MIHSKSKKCIIKSMHHCLALYQLSRFSDLFQKNLCSGLKPKSLNFNDRCIGFYFPNRSIICAISIFEPIYHPRFQLGHTSTFFLSLFDISNRRLVASDDPMNNFYSHEKNALRHHPPIIGLSLMTHPPTL